MPDCPLCNSPGSMVETLKQGYFCNGCAEAFQIDEAGRVIRRHPTNHSKLVHRDCQGNIIDGP